MGHTDERAHLPSLFEAIGVCVQVTILATNERIQAAASTNLSHALHYALLCLHETFSEHELYMVSAT